MVVGEAERVRVAIGSARVEQVRCRLALTAVLDFNILYLLKRKNIVSASLVGEGARTGKTYGPLMGRIWDPLLET